MNKLNLITFEDKLVNFFQVVKAFVFRLEHHLLLLNTFFYIISKNFETCVKI